MKKILLIAAIASTALSAYAQNPQTGCPYVKLHAGATKAQNLHDVDRKFKSKYSPIGTIAVGYNLTDTIRSDLSLDYFANTKFTFKRPTNHQEVKFKYINVLANLYADVYEYNGYTMFVGAGAGLSSFKAKSKIIVGNPVGTEKYRKSDTFSYAAYAGTSCLISEGIHGELMYSFKNLGKIVVKEKTRFKAHNLTAGVRIDL